MSEYEYSAAQTVPSSCRLKLVPPKNVKFTEVYPIPSEVISVWVLMGIQTQKSKQSYS